MPQDVVGFRFASFEVDLRWGELRKAGLRIRLQDQPLRILGTLLARPGELVTREELRRLLWPADTFVDFDRGLNNAMRRLREALGDSADSPRFIETLARRGYRFVASVEPVDSSVRGVLAAPSTPPEPPPAGAGTPSVRHLRGAALVATAIVAVGLASVALVRGRSTSQAAPPRKTMLVVLPFQNLSGDAEQEYLADGLTEEMIVRLGELHPHSLGVIARTSAMHYKDRGKDLRSIASELRADYALEGSIRRSDDRVRVTAQLIDTTDFDHVWAESYDREVRDVLEMQIEIARSIAREIRLIAADSRLQARNAVDPDAYPLYLRGRFLAGKRTTQGLRQGIASLEEAARREPRYAPIRASLAQAHLLAARYEVAPSREALAAARQAAEAALAIDPFSSQAHAVLGCVRLYMDWDWDSARAAFERSLELNPSDATARLWYGHRYLRGRGDYDEAIAQLRRAQALDPLSTGLAVALAETYIDAGRGADALDQSLRVLEMAPDFHVAYIEQGRALEMLGQYAAAEKSLKRGAELGRGSLTPVVHLARFQAARGRPAEARRLLAAAGAARRTYAPPLPQARLYAALGDVPGALTLLEKAVDERPIDLESLRHDSGFASLRSEPRFAAILRRIGPTNR